MAPRESDREVADLRYLLHLVMAALAVLLLTTTVGLYQQIRWLAAQANQLNATAQELSRLVGDYETNALPQLNRLFTDLQQFSQSHPDFARIMSRYRVVTDTSTAAAPPPIRPMAPPEPPR
ncbi:MAG: hypothetical protein HS113_27875 [Verrucomicrobiales bacterium]|nr:hypothetical protein [Verrucomicrobiales bacterium]